LFLVDADGPSLRVWVAAEQVIADRMIRLVNGTLPWPFIDPAKALP
jgi:hypothetical protein